MASRIILHIPDHSGILITDLLYTLRSYLRSPSEHPTLQSGEPILYPQIGCDGCYTALTAIQSFQSGEPILYPQIQWPASPPPSLCFTLHHSASHYITLHHTTSASHYSTHPSSSIIIIIIHHSAPHYTTLHHTTSLCITLHLHHITSAPKALESRQRRNTTRLRRNKSQMNTN